MNLTVLTVDDHTGVRELMRFLAADHDRVGTSLAAASAPAALELCEASKPDVIILDADLGQADGLALIGPLRQASPGCAVCVVSSAPYATADAALAAGADLFIQKGTDPDLVLDQALGLRADLS